VLVLLERSKCLPVATNVPDELKTEISLHSNASHELKESTIPYSGTSMHKPADTGTRLLIHKNPGLRTFVTQTVPQPQRK
jgi:hypothetical protein